MYHLSNNKSLPKKIAFKNHQGNLSYGESKTEVKQIKFHFQVTLTVFWQYRCHFP